MSATPRCRAFLRARMPVAVAMRVVAASLALQERAAGGAPAIRRSVFPRRAAAGLETCCVRDAGARASRPRDEDLP